MRRLLAALTLCLLSSASAHAQEEDDWWMWSSAGRSSSAQSITLNATGLVDCIGAVSCLRWNGASAVPVDSGSAAMAWSLTGAPTAISSTAIPATAAPGAAAGFSDANYINFGTASDPLDSSGDRFGCAAFNPATTTGNQVIVSNGTASVAGHYIQVASGSFFFGSSNPTAISCSPGNTVVAGGLNVACWWRTGATISAKLNLGTTNTNAAAGTEVAGTAMAANVGRYSGGAQPFSGQILGLVQGLGPCPTPPAPFAATCEGWATWEQSLAFGMLGSRAEQLSVTRVASTATVNGTTYNFPANIVRVGNPGVGQPAGAYDTGVGVTSPALPLASWCASGTWQPDAAAWNAVDATLWGVGTAAAANSARLRSLAAGQISCEVYDASAVARTAAWTHAYGSGSAHALACCNLNGAVSLYSDGSQVASTSTGGAGIWTVAPTAATWGAPSTAGWVRAPRECHSGSLGACR